MIKLLVLLTLFFTAGFGAAYDGFYRSEDIKKFYEIENRQLGNGYFGHVFLGRDRNTQKKVAIKKVFMNGRNRHFILREIFFLNYIRAKGGCPYIVNLIDAFFEPSFQENGTMYLVMEEAKGLDLSEYIKKENLRDNIILEIAQQLAIALNFLEQLGIAHRDIKTDNIRIDFSSDGKPHIILLDFGFARFFNLRQKRRNSTCGTLHFLPPEFFTNTTSDLKTRDSWAAGVSLYIAKLRHFPWRSLDVPGCSESKQHHAQDELMRQIKSIEKCEEILPRPGATQHNTIAEIVEQLMTHEHERKEIFTVLRRYCPQLQRHLVPKANSSEYLNLDALLFIQTLIRTKELAIVPHDAMSIIAFDEPHFINHLYDFLSTQFTSSARIRKSDVRAQIPFLSRTAKSSTVKKLLKQCSRVDH